MDISNHLMLGSLKMDKQNLITFVISSLIVTILAQSMVWFMILDEDSIIKLDCYDNHNNKIINQVCEKEVIGMSFEGKLLLSLLALILSIILNPYFWGVVTNRKVYIYR